MKPIRVALSGSGFKFPALVGALNAIVDAGYEVKELAGTSGGSIVCVLYAAGMPLDTLKYLALHHDWSGMLSFNVWSLFTKMGYCSGNDLHDFLIDNTQAKTFNDLQIDLTVVASDITFLKPYIFSKRTTPECPIGMAARCSSSIPLVYAAMTFDNRLIMDGGMVNNIPIDMLTDDGTQQIGIQLVSNELPMAGGIYSLKSIIERIVTIMLKSNDNAHVDLGIKDGAQVVFVETGYVDGLDNKMILADRTRLFNDGYNKTAEVLKGLK
jgi:NTE family protein